MKASKTDWNAQVSPSWLVLGGRVQTIFDLANGQLAARISSFESFISRIYYDCDQIIGDWLRNREAWKGLSAQIAARILDAVQQLFLKPVYSEITLKQIAQLANVTEGSIYRLFGNRAGMDDCVLRHTLTKITAFTRKLVAKHGAAELTLEDIAAGIGLTTDELRRLFPSMDALLKYILAAR